MIRAEGAESRLQILGRAWRNRSLRRLCLAVAGFKLAELGVWIALTAYAYGEGGVDDAALVMILQLVPATAFALVVGGLIGRFGAAPVLRWGLVGQCAGMAVTAIFLGHGHDPVAYAGAVLAATLVTTTRPAQSVLTPCLVDGPDELTAANVLSGSLAGVAGLAGPAIAAVLMTTVDFGAVFAVMAVVVATAAAATWTLPSDRVVIDEDPHDVLTGIRAVARAPGPRVIVLALAMWGVVMGAADVLAVVIAVKLLGRTEAFAGWVSTAFGAGMLAASALTVLIIGRRWLAPWILISGLGVGAALAGISLAGSDLPVSMAMLVAFGVAAATYELASLMLLQRVCRLDILGHVFAVVEALQMATLALGVAIVPAAVRWFGSDAAPAAVGGLLALVVAALGGKIVSIDRNARVPITEMAVLRSTRLFGALPAPALETVAREARRIVVPPGGVVVQQGDPGFVYYAIVSGELVVSRSGVERRTLGRGEGFGEIALIGDVPRTATVRAATDAVLLAVDREPFLTAVTGHAVTGERASSIAEDRIRSDREQG